MNAATPTPAPFAFAGPFQSPGVPRPEPYPAPFYQTWRPLVFPPVLPPGAFRGPRVYQPPPPPPGGFRPHPGTPFNPFGLPGFRPSHTYPPVSVLSHQRPAVIDGTFSPGAMTRPPIAPVPPANVFGPGAVTRPQPLVPPANFFGPGAVTRPPIAPVPPSNAFGPGAVARPPIAPLPPSNAFGPGAVARPPITHIPPANVFGPGALTRPPIAPVPPVNVFGPGAMARPSITHVPPANVFGFGAVTRPPIAPIPRANVFGPGAVTRPPITPVPQANVFGPGAVTRPPITPVRPATDFGPGAVTRSAIAPVPPANEPEFKVYVGKIASTVDNYFVLSLLQVCGLVKSWNPVTNPIDGTSTGFGFCDFESAEGCLRARRLLNKLSIDGQELLLNVNEATREYVQKYGQNTTEEKANEADKDAMQMIHSMVEERMRSKLPGSRITPIQVSASIGDEKGNGDTRSDALEQRKIMRQRENEERLRESKVVCLQGWKDREVTSPGKSSLQIDAIRSMYVPMERECTVEHERKRQHRESECTSSMYVPIGRESTVERERKRQHRESECISSMYVPMEREYTVEHERNRQHRESECISSRYVPMERESTVEHEGKRQHRESECISSRYVPMERESTVEHEGKRQHRESECFSSRYVPMERESTVEHEGKRQHRESECISSRYVPMERESTVEHERKCQHRERDGFHKSNGEGKGIVSVSGLVLDKLSSSAPGERVGFELQATCKPGNKETLDEEQLLAAVPKTKEELFAYDVNWAIYDKHGLHERMRPWVSEKSTEVFGEEIAEFVEYVVASTKEHVDAPRMLETLVSLMDDSAENFVLSFWTQLIFEIKKVETGLA